MRYLWFVLVMLLCVPLSVEAEGFVDPENDIVAVIYADTDDSEAVEVAMVPQTNQSACLTRKQTIEADDARVLVVCARSTQRIVSTEPSGALLYAYRIEFIGATVHFSGPRDLNKCLEDYESVERMNGKRKVPFLCGISAQVIDTPRARGTTQ